MANSSCDTLDRAMNTSRPCWRRLGSESLDELIRSTLPPSIQIDEPLDLPKAHNESETFSACVKWPQLNRVQHSMIGMGYHETMLPAVIQRNVLENPGWYTAYTPYQAEISQGRLEALLNFQQMVSDLTGMPIANASLLDEATAAAEAMTMLQRINRKSKSSRFLVDGNVLPQTLDVVENRARYFGIEVGRRQSGQSHPDGDYFGVLLQYPGVDGETLRLPPRDRSGAREKRAGYRGRRPDEPGSADPSG